MSDDVPIFTKYGTSRVKTRAIVIPDGSTPSPPPSRRVSPNHSTSSVSPISYQLEYTETPSPRVGRSPSEKGRVPAGASFEGEEYYYHDRSLSPYFPQYVDKRVLVESLRLVIPEGKFNVDDVQVQTNLLLELPRDISTRIMCIAMGINDGKTMEFGQLSRILRDQVRELRRDVNDSWLSFEESERKLTELRKEKDWAMAQFTQENYKIFTALKAPKEPEPSWDTRKKNNEKQFNTQIAKVLSKRGEEIDKRNNTMPELRQAKKLLYFMQRLMSAANRSQKK